MPYDLLLDPGLFRGRLTGLERGGLCPAGLAHPQGDVRRDAGTKNLVASKCSCTWSEPGVPVVFRSGEVIKAVAQGDPDSARAAATCSKRARVTSCGASRYFRRYCALFCLFAELVAGVAAVPDDVP